MGNSFSLTPTGESETHFISESEDMADTNTVYDHEEPNDILEDEFFDTSDEQPTRAKEQEMEDFKKDLAKKREQRREILARHREEKDNLSKSLNIERKAKLQVLEENKALRELLRKHNIQSSDSSDCNTDEDTDIMITITQLQEELEIIKENNKRLRKDLAGANFSLQAANADIAGLNFQNIESTKQIKALKEVVTVSKTMIGLREQQLNELKEKLSQIEQSLAERETNLLSTDLKLEYEKQLQNIRTLRGLYEERARLAEVTRLNLLRELEEEKRSHLSEVNRCIELTGKVEELEKKVSTLSESIENKTDEIKSTQEETKGLKAEMLTVNKLFSQVLLGYKSKQNWDQLVLRLEENHGILSHMVEQDDGFESSSALPKLLLELVNQVDENDVKCAFEESTTIDGNKSEEDINNSQEKINLDSQKSSAEEIVENLPKVWKVLLELLSHQNSNDTNTPEKITTCYKTVETASGSVLVPSVSQTYIRLKDLILEKLSLNKEVNKMKQLNNHLESRLGEQERRLCLVTSELSKTWHVVGRLRRHHHQLHTHEKILKYELQQKRKLLTELKEELEYCRERWETAREKNTQSEKDWKKLRAEFSSRKTKISSPLFNNSGESGYSDERPSDDSSESNDDSECVNTTPLRLKKKIKKSFDNVLDSSADFNLTAEREDPISDMIDVADLPLDSHELEEIAERPGTSSAQTEDSCSESCNLLKSDKTHDETEDELCDIAIELCSEEQSTSDNLSPENNNDTASDNNIEHIPLSTSNETSNISDIRDRPDDMAKNIKINPAEILAKIRKQNEKLAEKDKRLESLEKNSLVLLRNTQSTISKGEQLNNTLDHILSRPGTSLDANTISIQVNENTPDETIDRIILPNQIERSITEDMELNEGGSSFNDNSAEKEPNPDESCAAIQKESLTELLRETCNQSKVDTIDKPSTSRSDVDHEAIFAARDIRLKRLEEQTKSLVNKVNDTTTKGVKIHYKLEELHNIYGSENSRAGTPSTDINNEGEDENVDENKEEK